MFDPEKFGQAMGEAIRKAVEPLQAEIAALKKQLADPMGSMRKAVTEAVDAAVKAIPAAKDGKDCDMAAVKAMIEDAVKAIPAPKDGKDADPAVIEKMVSDAVNAIPKPQDGKSVTLDDVRPILDAEIKAMREQFGQTIDAAIKAIPVPNDGKDGKDGKDGEKGADGIGLAGAMIDREGSLLVTMTNGEVRSLGPVVGKDGENGKDGKDGISLDSFELEYLDETHEVRIKAACGDRVKEVRYPAGGIRPAGYWREGVKAAAGEAWTRDGSLWIAKHATSAKPEAMSEDWILAARKGRDGERGQKGADATPPTPIKLKD